ncbi:MAG TPA: alpha/beta hydrolase [Aeromicrobium sp.]|nr:alpha/beta hydrolase [Aeromicrobium sp.]
MSTPKSLEIPEGVVAATIETSRGPFATHTIRVPDPEAHVLLIPGWTGSKEDFTPLLPLLASVGFDATAYDQRGQFETPGADDDDYSLSGFAADAASLARECATEPTHLLGHSFGGLVAQAAALDSTSTWRSVSLLDTGPGALGDSTERPLSALVEALGHIPLVEIHRYRENGVQRVKEIASFLERRFTSNSVTSLRAMTEHLMHAPDRIADLHRLRLPVWVGRGADDDAWPHDVQAAMAERLGVEIHVVADSAHSPAVENPQGLADAWFPFLLKNT